MIQQNKNALKPRCLSIFFKPSEGCTLFADTWQTMFVESDGKTGANTDSVMANKYSGSEDVNSKEVEFTASDGEVRIPTKPLKNSIVKPVFIYALIH